MKELPEEELIKRLKKNQFEAIRQAEIEKLSPIIKFLKLISIIKTYHYDIIVYLDSNDKPVKKEITSRILTIDKIAIEAWCETAAVKKAFTYIKKYHPKYKETARLF